MFGLLMFLVDCELESAGLSARSYFWDDSTLAGDPQALAKAAWILVGLEPETNLCVHRGKSVAYFVTREAMMAHSHIRVSPCAPPWTSTR